MRSMKRHVVEIWGAEEGGGARGGEESTWATVLRSICERTNERRNGSYG